MRTNERRSLNLDIVRLKQASIRRALKVLRDAEANGTLQIIEWPSEARVARDTPEHPVSSSSA